MDRQGQLMREADGSYSTDELNRTAFTVGPDAPSSEKVSVYATPRSSDSPIGEVPARQPDRRRRRKWIILGSVLAFVLVGLGVGLGVGLTVGRASATDNLAGPDGTGSDNIGSEPSVVTPDSSSGSGSTTTSVSRSIDGYANLVVFGASYCDNAHPRASVYAKSETTSPYWQGRWSNGPVWAEYLQTMIGPAKNGVSTGANATLIDRAYAGAVISSSIGQAYPVPDVVTQVSGFMSDLKGGNETIAAITQPDAGRTLVATWIGLNALEYAMSQLHSGNQTATWAAGMISQSATILTSTLQSIANSSVWQGTPPDFLVLPIQNVNQIPDYDSFWQSSPANLSLIKNLTSDYNAGVLAGAQQIAKSLASTSAKVFTYDIVSLYNAYTSTPSRYNLTNVSGSCYNPTSGGSVCSNPRSFLYFDGKHPTTTIHRNIAQRLKATLFA